MSTLYPNWATICNIKDYWLRMAMALLNLSTDEGQLFATSLPQYFTTEKPNGPVLLSVILEQAKRHGHLEGSASGREHPVSHEAVPEHIPVIEFDITGDNLVGDVLPRLPSTVSPSALQGSIVTINGKDFVVLENNCNCEIMYLAPAEYIEID